MSWSICDFMQVSLCDIGLTVRAPHCRCGSTFRRVLTGFQYQSTRMSGRRFDIMQFAFQTCQTGHVDYRAKDHSCPRAILSLNRYDGYKTI